MFFRSKTKPNQAPTLLCPFCLRDIPSDAEKCPHEGCSKEIPALYRQHYDTRQNVIVSAVGFGGHGKTVYLTSLLHVLNRMAEYWPGFYRQALNMTSLARITENLAELENCQLPLPTRITFPEPSLHQLSHMPYFGERMLMIYDPAGESFEGDVTIMKNAHFVARSRMVLFFFSLSDFDDPTLIPRELDRLLEIYILGMGRLKADISKQHLMVVYTKGDRLDPFFHNCRMTPNYIRFNEVGPGWNMETYLKGMVPVSQELRDFTKNHLRAYSFMNRANQFASVEFSAVSALGAAPQDGHLVAQIAPRRVLDPLLWAITKSMDPANGK